MAIWGLIVAGGQVIGSIPSSSCPCSGTPLGTFIASWCRADPHPLLLGLLVQHRGRPERLRPVRYALRGVGRLQGVLTLDLAGLNQAETEAAGTA
jgi:hypothetical protein